jgi:predicted outer membrane protein
MITKVLMSAAAAALISTAAYAQQQHSDPAHGLSDAQSSATNPSTVNPPADVESRVSVDPHAGVAATTGETSDVVGISADSARAQGMAVQTVTNGPVPDTTENRARYGAPMSRAGKMTRPTGN